jgi:hypothetical protein
MNGDRNTAWVCCVVLIFISGGGASGGLTSNGIREMIFTASSLFECVVIDGSVTSEIE